MPLFFYALLFLFRRQSLLPRKSEAKRQKKMMKRKLIQTQSLASKEDDNSNENISRIITFGSMPSYREDKRQELKRHKEHGQSRVKSTNVSGLENRVDDILDENSQFFELSPNNLSKVTHHHEPDKRILKSTYGTSSTNLSNPFHQTKEKHWSEEALGQECPSDENLKSLSEAEKKLKCLNGYHEGILETLNLVSANLENATRQSPADSKKRFNDPLSDYGKWHKLFSSYIFNYLLCSLLGLSLMNEAQVTNVNKTEENLNNTCGPIRIRNLEDLLRQLEQQETQTQSSQARPTSQHVSTLTAMSSSGSDEVRLSEQDADQHLYNTGSLGAANMRRAQLSFMQHPSSSSTSSQINPLEVEQRLQQILNYRHLDITPPLPPPPPPVARFELS